jgi:hypothetical protein
MPWWRVVSMLTPLVWAVPCLAQSDAWPLERIVVQGGREFRGVLLEETKGQLEFAEIVRRRGTPMFAIIHAVSHEDLSRYQSLSAAERATLLERFNTLRHRALIEAGRMDTVQLASVQRDGIDYLNYDGPWFSMLSTADQRTTRRSIVRIEQTFRAYRQILPPRIARFSSFQIYLFGSAAEYRAALARWGVELQHPAFYSPERNVIVAGTDLDRFSAELAKSVEENERTRRQLRGLKASHEQTLAQVSSDMKQAGFTADDIESEIRSRRSAWKQQQAKVEEEIDQVERKNAARFDEVARSMFHRLNHEAFHAYLENYVYPHDDFQVPHWLNEGLAQVFENAQLDADTLRVDAPARDLLPRLQADLKGKQPLSLAELLSSDESLIAAHRNNDATRRRYLYAWGLAHYLAFHRSGLGTKEFESYIAKEDPASPIARFERWVGLPLAEFEQQWRKEMLQLR